MKLLKCVVEFNNLQSVSKVFLSFFANTINFTHLDLEYLENSKSNLKRNKKGKVPNYKHKKKGQSIAI